MTPKKAARNGAKKPKRVAEIIELSSDSEPDVLAVVTQVPAAARAPSSVQYTEEDYQNIPLLRVEPIKYSTQQPAVNKASPADEKTPAKLPMRVKDTGSARHRRVSIEIPLMTSSLLASHKHGRGSAEEEGGNEEVFKTPMERRHITFDDSDHEEFVTPLEAPAKNPLELTSPKPAEHDAGGQQRGKTDTEEDDDDSDDEAPPEAISSHAAEASLAKASQAAVRSAEQQAAAQKRKCKERDAVLKQQAEQRKQGQEPISLISDQESEEHTVEISSAPLIVQKRKRDVPAILPLEFLESDDENETTPQETTKRQRISTKRNGWLAEPKAPRDQKVGSTVFRVVENRGDGKLAPKVSKPTLNMKEKLLQRNRVPQARGGGFFVKGR